VSCPFPDLATAAIRWPDPGDLRSEALAPALIASPSATRLYIDLLKAVLDNCDTCEQTVTELYRAAVIAGQSRNADGPEVAGYLAALADALRDSLDEWGEVER
jgi:hypothetical protein